MVEVERGQVAAEEVEQASTSEVRVKADPEYMKTLMEVFEASTTAFVSIEDLQVAGVENNETLLFHMLQFSKSELILNSRDHTSRVAIGGRTLPASIGTLVNESYMLTPKGYEFLGALRSKSIGERVKSAVLSYGLQWALQSVLPSLIQTEVANLIASTGGGS